MPDDLFATTRWTMVFAAGKARDEDSSASGALEDLCRIYWFPLYAYVRRRGYVKEDAEDLTQMFFAKLLERPDFSGLHRGEGKFRAFLLASLKHFLANEWDKASALKRGGHLTRLSLDWSTADVRYGLADDGLIGPDKAFDREWALALLERVVAAVREEWVAGGKAERFDEYKCFLTMGKAKWTMRRSPPARARMNLRCGSPRIACANATAICCGKRSSGRWRTMRWSMRRWPRC